MRRLKPSLKTYAITLVLMFGLTGMAAHAGPPWRIDDGFPTNWATLKVTVTQLTAHLYFLHASGGNTVASVGPDGTLLVDPEFAQAVPRLIDALKQINAGPVRIVIDTHYHPDHAGGNAAFHRAGAVVIAQQNVTARLSTPQHSYYWGYTSKAAAEDALPMVTFDRALHVRFNAGDIELIHGAPSHTDTDTIVYFRKDNVVHMGDIFLTRLYPYIDINAKGTIDGYFPVIDKILGMIDDKTIVVPGHGPISDRAGLISYRTMLKTIRDRVAAQIARGATLEQIIATHPSREFDDRWASDRVGPEGIVVMIYQSLTGKRLDWKPAPARE